MQLTDRYPENYFFFENRASNKSLTVNRHYHDMLEIYYLEEGSCRYFIDNKSYDVRAGDLVFIPERVIHHTTYYGEHYKRKLIYCGRSLVPYAVSGRLSSFTYLYRNSLAASEIKALLLKIEKEYISPDIYSGEVIEMLLAMLFFVLARNENEFSGVSVGNKTVTEAVEYIQNGYMHDVSLSEAAKNLSVSPEHLSRIFKRETGMGFSEYLTLVRLKRAEELLKSGVKMSMTEIAYASGFNDSNYFSEKFKSYYGVSPTKYRKI